MFGYVVVWVLGKKKEPRLIGSFCLGALAAAASGFAALQWGRMGHYSHAEQHQDKGEAMRGLWSLARVFVGSPLGTLGNEKREPLGFPFLVKLGWVYFETIQ